MVTKPVVDRLERKLNGKAELIRLDLLSEVGRQAAARYGIQAVPTMILLDRTGQLVYSHYGLSTFGELISQVDNITVIK